MERKKLSPKECAHVKLSKLMSKLLRWSGLSEGLVIGHDGYTPVKPFLEHLSKLLKHEITYDELLEVTESNVKKRFELAKKPANYDPYDESKTEEEPIWFVREVQGHGLKDEAGNPWIDPNLLLTKITDPSELPVCFHGTYRSAVSGINKTGLSRCKRDHIHCAKGLPGDKDRGGKTVISGMRNSCQVLVHIKVAEAMKAGHEFLCSSNDVVLVKGPIPAELLEFEYL